MKIDTLVDYTNHPAFAPYAAQINPQDGAVIKSIFNEIDQACEVLMTTGTVLSPQFIINYFAAHIDPMFLEIAKLCNSLIPSANYFADIMPTVIEETRKCLYDQIIYEQGKKTSIYNISVSAPAKEVAEDLRTQGVSLRQVPQEYLTHIYNSIPNYRAELEKQAVENPNKLLGSSLPMEGAHWQIAREILKATGIYDGVSMHYQYQMEPLYISLNLSHDKQTWFNNPYQDLGLPNSRLTYMHYDHDHDVVKSIMYLNEVTEENGPFQIVPESFKWIPSATQGVFFKFLDQNNNKKLVRISRDKTDYYRPFFKLPDLRADFMQLPTPIRGSSHFGDDLLDNTPLSKILAAKELSVTSNLSNCFCFRGSETMHRGGIAHKGVRWIYSVAFRKSGGPN